MKHIKHGVLIIVFSIQLNIKVLKFSLLGINHPLLMCGSPTIPNGSPAGLGAYSLHMVEG